MRFSQLPSGPTSSAPVPELTRAWMTWIPLLITIIAGLASMIIPTRLQQRASAVRNVVINLVEPARDATKRAEAAFTEEVGTTRLFASGRDTALGTDTRLAQLATDSALDSLSRLTRQLSSRTAAHSDAMRQAIVRWRGAQDGAAPRPGDVGGVDSGLRTQQAHLDDVLMHADSLSASLKSEMVARRNVILRLNEQSMVANVWLAMLGVTSVIAVAWLTRRQLALTRSLRNRTEEEIALREVARALSGARSVTEMASMIAEGAVRATGARGAYVEQRIDSTGGGVVEVIAQHGDGTPPTGTRVAYPGSLTGQIIEHGEPSMMTELGLIGESMAPYLTEHCAGCSGVVVPLITWEQALGALVLLRAESQAPFAEDELWRARILGDICTAALRRAVLTDAIERERAEKALMLDSAGDGIYSIDAEGRFTFLNRAGAEMLGYSPDEVLGQDSHLLVHHTRSDGKPYPREACPILLAEKAGRGIHVTDEVYWRKDGTSFATEYTSFPLRRGEHEGMVITFRDITARRSAEQERERLLEAERHAHVAADRRARQEVALRKTAEALGGGYTRADVSRQVAEWALVATEARGAFVSELSGRADTVTVTAVAGEGVPRIGESAPIEKTYTQQVLRSGKPVIIDDIASAPRWVHPSIAERCADCSVLIVPLHVGNEPVGALWLISRGPDGFGEDQLNQARIFADLGALAYQKVKLLEAVEQRRAQLEQVMGSRSRLMRGFSHDVKNPLGAADGHAALLLEGIYGPLADPQRESVERIRRSIRHALGLIDDLHELARAEAGMIDVRREEVDMRELLAGLAEDYRAAADAAHLTLSVEICTTRTRVVTDGRRLRQILGNLVSNAIKYTDNGGVKLRLDRPDAGPEGQRGDWVDVDVADSGPGIPGDKIGLLFREFSRIDPREKPGAGLGLAISQRLAEALGGRIMVRSAPGHGSTFSLWVPDGNGRRAA